MVMPYSFYLPIASGAAHAPTPEEALRQVQEAAVRGRQSRDVTMLGNRRLVNGIAITLGMFRDVRLDELPLALYDQMRRDDMISAGLTLLKAPILGRLKRASVQCDNPAIKRVIEHLFLEQGLFYRLGRSSFRALDFGVAFHEIEWETAPLDLTYTETDEATGQEFEQPAWQGPGLWPKAIHEVNPETVREIRRDPDTHAYNGFIQRGYPEAIVEAVNSFVYTHDSEFGNMWGTPRTKGAYAYWLWKQAVLKFWMQWVEGKADPARISRYPKGETVNGEDNGIVALDAALALSNQTAVALPSDGVSETNSNPAWDITELTTTDRTDAFVKPLNEMNSAMLRSMFVSERAFNPNVRDTGTYSEVKAQTDTFLLTEDALQEDWIECVNHYAVARVVELNFGPDAEAATIVLPGITDEERAFERATFTALLSTGDPTLGGVLDVREMADREGLPTTDPTPTQAGDNATAPVGPGMGAGSPAAGWGPAATPDPTGMGGVAPELDAGDVGQAVALVLARRPRGIDAATWQAVVLDEARRVGGAA